MSYNKTGLNYYNTDTDRYQDIRIKRLKRAFGCNGIAVYDYILCEVYRDKGCYLTWEENIAFDVADYFGLDESQVHDIVRYCAEVGLFDPSLLSRGIITSASIQEKYLDSCKAARIRRVSIPEEYRIVAQDCNNIEQNLHNNKGKLCNIEQNCIGVAKKEEIPLTTPKEEKYIYTPPKEKKLTLFEEIPPQRNIDQPSHPLNNSPTHAAHEVEGSAAAAKEAKTPDPDFEAFWEAYGKKRGRRDVEAYWARLPARDKAAALSGVPGYVAANPDPAYRKDPIRYLRHRCWEDENYSTTDKKPNEPHDTERPTAYMARYF